MGGLFSKNKNNAPIAKQGNRINAIQIQQSTYGAVEAVVYGTNRLAGDIIDYIDFKAIAHTTSVAQSSGGKGGGSSNTVTNTYYTYTAKFVIGLCHGTIIDVGTVWKGKDVTTLATLGLSLFKGSDTQIAWGEMTTYHPERALNYRNLAYIAGTLDLGDSPSSPNFNFEIEGKYIYGGGIVDANPKDIIYDILTNTIYGAGFTSSFMADLSDFSDYCVANGFFISPAMTSHKDAYQVISEIAKLSNSELVWSQGVLKILPLGDTEVTGNSVTWTPDLTPIYNLDDNDFINPITCTRTIQSDVFNSVKLEYLNRDNDYNVEIIDVLNQASIEVYGHRPLSPISAHMICNPLIAKLVAQTILDRNISYRNKYKFTLPMNFILLDPIDLVTITDESLGLDLELVRIIAINEDSNGDLEIEAEEMAIGCATAALYPDQDSTRTSIDYNIDPSDVNTPIVFEPAFILTANEFQVWIGLSGSAEFWGGAEIYISEDDVTFKKIGQVYNPVRQGVLTQQLSTNLTNPDETNTLSIDLTMSESTILDGTQTDVDNYNTLCYVDGELLAYKDTALTGTNKYDIEYLNRNLYETSQTVHAIGSQFARIDSSVFFKYTFREEDIGKILYIKTPSFNVFNNALQDLSTLDSISYTLTGFATFKIPSDVISLCVGINLFSLIFNWEDDNYDCTYEIREGISWVNSQVVDVDLVGLSYSAPLFGTGTRNYFIKAKSRYGVYSENIMSYDITITESLLRNIVLSKNLLINPLTLSDCKIYNEKLKPQLNSLNNVWGGRSLSKWRSDDDTYVRYYAHDGEWGFNAVDLPTTIGLEDESGAYLTENDELFEFEDANYGAYKNSSYLESDEIDVGANLESITYLSFNFDEINNVQNTINFYWKYKTSTESYQSEWQPFTAGSYEYRYCKFKIILVNPTFTPSILSSASVNIDVPDRIEFYNDVTISASGTTLNFATDPQSKLKKNFTIVPNVVTTPKDSLKTISTVWKNKTISSVDLFLYDKNDNAIAGVADITVKGY